MKYEYNMCGKLYWECGGCVETKEWWMCWAWRMCLTVWNDGCVELKGMVVVLVMWLMCWDWNMVDVLRMWWMCWMWWICWRQLNWGYCCDGRWSQRGPSTASSSPHLQTHDTCGDTAITQPYSQSKSYSSKSFNHIELFERISVITKLYSQSKFYVHHNHSTIFRIKITFIL